MFDWVLIALALLAVGAFAGACRVYALGDSLPLRTVAGKTGVSACTSLVAGIILLRFADAPPLAVVGAGAALAILGPEAVARVAKRVIR